MYKCKICEQRLLISLEFHKKKVHSWMTLCVTGHVLRSDNRSYYKVDNLKY